MRNRTFRRLGLITAATAVALLISGCSLSKLKISGELAARSEPFQARPAQPRQRLLVIGDSTAVGTGASMASASVAGLISRDHPEWLIDNRAADGAKFADLPAQMPLSERYDTVLIMCGGNDVLRFTGSAALQEAIKEVLRRSHALAPRVILLPPGNVGNAPALYRPLSWWMSDRSRTLHALVREAAVKSGAVYVNLFQERENDPFAQDPLRMNAADGLHPSDVGYALWYRGLKAQAGL